MPRNCKSFAHAKSFAREGSDSSSPSPLPSHLTLWPAWDQPVRGVSYEPFNSLTLLLREPMIPLEIDAYINIYTFNKML